MSRIVIALGGNALGDNPVEQQQMIAKSASPLIGLIAQGHEIIVCHGNGPQVGMIQKAFDLSSKENKDIPELDLPECTAMSQGYIGYHLQKGLLKELHNQNMPWHVATVVTQMVVDENDPAFLEPTKPVGSFVDEATARRIMSENPEVRYINDAGRGWRRVVASPKPQRIVEVDSILNLLDHEFIVIACGGGGVPVVSLGNGSYKGVAAVIDKDFSAAKLAEAVQADYLFILTAVDRVAVNWGKPDQRNIEEMSVEEARAYCEQGQFAPGSMLPKVEAAMAFASAKPGNTAVIASLDKAPLAMQGKSGTVIRMDVLPQAHRNKECQCPA